MFIIGVLINWDKLNSDDYLLNLKMMVHSLVAEDLVQDLVYLDVHGSHQVIAVHRDQAVFPDEIDNLRAIE